MLHKAIQQAVAGGYVNFNPADSCTLPRRERKEMKPLDDVQIATFMESIKNHRFEKMFTVMLFAGLRVGERIGLKWDRVDFQRGAIIIDRQLQKQREEKGKYMLTTVKNEKRRIVTPATFVMSLLQDLKLEQESQRKVAGALWANENFVFTDALGAHVRYPTLYSSYKRIVTSIGRPDARLHDLRHSYAVASIRSGDDIKTVQGNLGHATAAFTLDVYGHVTDQMKAESAARMDKYIKSILGQ